MQRKAWVMVLLISLAGCESTGVLEEILNSGSGSSIGLPTKTIAAGLREALTVGSERVADTLGTEGGFANSAFRIPLPDKLKDAQEIAGRFGLSKPFDQLEDEMNKAAEAAAPKAKRLFVNAVKQMTFEDVMAVYRGGDDAATRYLERSTGTALNNEMRGVVDDSLSKVGAVNTLENLVSRYNALPLVKPIEADMTEHVLGYASSAIFTRLAEEEKAIRREPVKRSTELLRQVFGSS